MVLKYDLKRSNVGLGVKKTIHLGEKTDRLLDFENVGTDSEKDINIII